MTHHSPKGISQLGPPRFHMSTVKRTPLDPLNAFFIFLIINIRRLQSLKPPKPENTKTRKQKKNGRLGSASRFSDPPDLQLSLRRQNPDTLPFRLQAIQLTRSADRVTPLKNRPRHLVRVRLRLAVPHPLQILPLPHLSQTHRGPTPEPDPHIPGPNPLPVPTNQGTACGITRR